MPREDVELDGPAGLAQTGPACCISNASGPRLWCETSWQESRLEGVVPVEPQKVLCGEGAGSGVVHKHNAASVHGSEHGRCRPVSADPPLNVNSPLPPVCPLSEEL